MKTLFSFLFFLLFSISSFSQIQIGLSLKNIRDEIDKKGYVKKEGVTEAGERYVGATNHPNIYLYYFDEHNRCAYEVHGDKTFNKDDWDDSLELAGYVKKDEVYYNHKTKIMASIKWSEEGKIWLVTLEPMN